MSAGLTDRTTGTLKQAIEESVLHCETYDQFMNIADEIRELADWLKRWQGNALDRAHVIRLQMEQAQRVKR